MIKKLNKHKLDFDTTWVYLKDNLNGTNELSSQLLNLLNFKNGYFYTLLPSDANLTGLYDFKAGGILPQYPEVEYFVSGIRSTYSPIPCIDEELSRLIFDEIKLRNDISCVIDEVSFSLKNVVGYELFDNHGLFFEEEVYYLLDKKNISIELILKCLNDSCSFWHSLCVFTAAKCAQNGKNLNLEKIQEICLLSKIVMVGAYDGEGYVFWEENVIDSEKEFFIS